MPGVIEALDRLGVEEGRSLTETYLTVLDGDPFARKLVSKAPETKGHVYSSLAGFMSYARWIKSRK